MQPSQKLVRMLFVGAWFFAAPFWLAVLSVKLLRAPPDLMADGLFDLVRCFVRDQEVPAGIVLFTLFEMGLWSVRHRLPMSDRLTVAGRQGLPAEVRDDYEAAAQLVEEVSRILARNDRAVLRDVSQKTREELEVAVEELRHAMNLDPFVIETFQDAYDKAMRRARVLERWQKSEFREYVESIGGAVLVAVLLRAVVVEAFKIPSGSMLPTLQIGDHIFVNKFVYGPVIPFTNKRIFEHMPPERGDVIVFENPDHGPGDEREDYIKRVIALPGDVVEAEGGHPIINGFRVPSCHVGTYTFSEQRGGPVDTGELYVEYLGAHAYLTYYEAGHFERHEGPFIVEQGQVWVFGDNRNNSRDSRAWFGGRGGGAPYESIKGRAMFVWLPMDRFLVNVMGTPVLPKGAPPDMVSGIAKCMASRPSPGEATPPSSRSAGL